MEKTTNTSLFRKPQALAEWLMTENVIASDDSLNSEQKAARENLANDLRDAFNSSEPRLRAALRANLPSILFVSGRAAVQYGLFR